MDDDGNEVGPGEPGELFARSPLLLAGYLRRRGGHPGRDTTPTGFFSVGDVAVRDEEGFITIFDRKNDMIIAGGVNIFPREIEEVMPATSRSTRSPSSACPTRCTASASPRSWWAARDADRRRSPGGPVRQHVARYKMPREWHVVDALPRNPSGKILKRMIRDGYLALSEGD